MDVRPPEKIRADLSYLFDKASQVLASRMAAALDGVGITVRDYCVLSKASAGGLTQSELAELALLDKTTMVVTVDGLEAAGLAERRPSPQDRRARVVAVTGKGAEAVDRARTVIDGLYADVLGALDPPQRDALLDALVRLVGPAGPLAETAPEVRAPRRKSARSR
jgi:MarR family transcriptional regulator, transcriptional regulator for hemolysin